MGECLSVPGLPYASLSHRSVSPSVTLSSNVTSSGKPALSAWALLPPVSPSHSYLSTISCYFGPLVARESNGKCGTRACVPRTYLLPASPSGVCCQSKTLSAGSLQV